MERCRPQRLGGPKSVGTNQRDVERFRQWQTDANVMIASITDTHAPAPRTRWRR
jgi:hypothetical protein